MVPDELPDTVLRAFGAALIPEAFERPTCASRVALEERVAGRADFEAWTAARLDEALEETWRGTHPLAVGALSDGRLRWAYEECGCRRLECVGRTLREEAQLVAEPWVFGAQVQRAQGGWEDGHDAAGRPLAAVWRAPSRTDWLVVWYAEARGRNAASTQAGFLELEGDTLVSHGALGARDTWTTRELHHVLYRHPARKRFPLRRGRRR